MDVRSLLPFSGSSSSKVGKEDDPFALMRREMDRLFDSFSHSWGERGWGPQNGVSAGFLSPKVDVAETEKGLEVTAELPGISGATVDFAFAFDVFVHTGPELLHQYIRTMSRVLKPDGRALLHYLPWNPDTLGDWERVWQHSHRGKHSGMYYNSLESIRVSATSCGLVASHVDHTMKWSGELVELTRK